MSRLGNRQIAWLYAAIDRHLPREIREQDATTRQRARLCVLVSFIGVIGTAMGLVIQISLGRPAAGIAVTGVAVVVAGLSTQLVRLTRSVRVAGTALVALAYVFLTTSAVIAGGLGTPRGLSLVLVPTLATLLVGWRPALYWLGATTLVILVLFVLTFTGPDISSEIGRLASQRSHAAGIIVIMAVFMLVAASYERAHASVAEELERAVERAEAVNRVKDALIANVSHELRTPLNGILGSVDLLLRSRLDEAQRSHGETIEGSSEVLLRLVDDLLDMSRLEAGGMELQTSAIDLRRALDQIVSALAPLAEAHDDLIFVLHVDADVPEHIVTDPFRLRQVLTNLLSNALKFTTEGHVTLHLSRVGGAVRFEVRDTGIGIAPEDRARVFGAFQQASASTAHNYGGTGLGLNITQQLVRLMGSEVQLESEVGVGSRFFFDVFLRVPETQPPPVPSERYRVALELLDPAEAAAAREALSWAGHTVVEAEDESDVLLHDGKEPRGEWSVRVVAPSKLGERSRGEVRLARPFAPGRLSHALWRAVQRVPATRSALSSIAGGQPVLVADDNPVNRRVASGQLIHLGYEPVVVVNGREALEAIQTASSPFAGIFLDVRMPVMGGLEAVRALRAWEREEARSPTVVWALTAHEESGQRQEALRAGFDRFFVKPLRIGDLETILDRFGAPFTVDPKAVDPSPSSEAVIDPATWADLASLDEGDPGFLKSLVDGFSEVSDGHLRELRDADTKRAAELGHTMKGASRQLGALAFASVCAQLESEPEERDRLLPQLEKALQKTRAAMLERIRAGASTS